MLETLRIAVTLAAFTSFLAIVWWAYAPSRKAEWEKRGLLGDDEFGDGARTPEPPAPRAHARVTTPLSGGEGKQRNGI